jgi:hypothetical protein
MTLDPRVQQRKRELLADADVLLDAIAHLGVPGRDPFIDPNVLATAAEIGLLDAPHLRGNAAACGAIVTRMVNGASVAFDPDKGEPIPELERVARALKKHLSNLAVANASPMDATDWPAEETSGDNKATSSHSRPSEKHDRSMATLSSHS